MANEKVLPLEQIAAASTPTDSARIVIHDSAGSANYIDLATLKRLVRESIQIGGRNLIKNSGTSKDGSYGIGPYESVELLTEGDTYTVSAYGVIIGEGKEESLALWDAVGSYRLAIMNKVGEGIYSGTFVAEPKGATLLKFRIYSAPNNIGSTIIGKIKLERGNIATDWTPAPEDWGG